MDFWDADTVELEKMTYEVVKDTQTAVDLFESGTIDRVELSSDLVDHYASSEEYATRSKPVIYYLRMNQTRNEALRSEEHTSELQSRGHLVCRLLLEKKKVKR